MVKEAYVSFKVAMLLKEKGFKEKCRGAYHSGFDDVGENPIVMFEEWTAKPYNNDFVDEEVLCYAPTHQMAMAWLREVHKLFIEIGVSLYLNGYHYSYTILDNKCKYLRINSTNFDWTYEDAVEAALKYSLKDLI